MFGVVEAVHFTSEVPFLLLNQWCQYNQRYWSWKLIHEYIWACVHTVHR